VGKRGVEPPAPCECWASAGSDAPTPRFRGTSRYVARLTRHRVGHVPPGFNLTRAWSALALRTARPTTMHDRRYARPSRLPATVRFCPQAAVDGLATASSVTERATVGSVPGCGNRLCDRRFSMVAQMRARCGGVWWPAHDGSEDGGERDGRYRAGRPAFAAVRTRRSLSGRLARRRAINGHAA
jgi:hypothetical protein